MTNYELIKVAFMCFVIIAVAMAYGDWCKDKRNKGIAVSNYLSMMHDLDIPPEEARYIDINANTYDVSIESLDIFAK